MIQNVLRAVDTSDVHVLAVDDSLIDRKVVERLLKNSSYKVTTVDSALRALEVLGMVGSSPLVMNAVKINLIITDYCMPEMTGYDLLKKIKESSALKQIPVVIMSSENVPSRISMCLAEGAEEFILKPLQVADVKRLKVHIKPDGDTSEIMSNTGICTKRKAGKESLDEVTSLKRHQPSSVNNDDKMAAIEQKTVVVTTSSKEVDLVEKEASLANEL